MPRLLPSLALTVLPALHRFGRNGLAVLDGGEGAYWFVALTDGELSVLSDVYGSADTVRMAVKTWQRFLTVSPDFCLAPEGLLPDLPTETVSAEALLPRHSRLQAVLAPWRSGMRQVSTQKSNTRLVLLAVTVIAGWLGWQHWQAQQAAARDRTEHAAFLARQAGQKKPVIAPWNSLPSPAVMVSSCTNQWKALPLSVAGWTFGQVECGPDNQGHPVLVSRYQRASSSVVGDFTRRLRVYYPGVTPAFNIPGAANTAQFILPVEATRHRPPQQLQPSATLLEAFTSWSQQISAALTLRKATGTRNVPLPYALWHFTLKTDIPPEHLFHRAFPGLVIRKIVVSLSAQDARLHYTLEGELYAR